ncbi:MAG: thiol reductant ABC exporter subunit CydD [Limimaricola sp.]|nr:thiol reductant ABC exporter subunit CydD [Limimaricola sp.]
MARPLARLTAGSDRALRTAGWLTALAALLWLPQAAVLAQALAAALHGHPPAALPTVAAFVGFGALRAILSYLAEGRLYLVADTVAATARAHLVAREARRGGTAPAGPGAIAALVAEKIDLLTPYLTRYAPARARVMVVTPVILLISFAQSWAVGLVLLVSGPLIPVFQALVGMAAKEASQRQMTEIASLNDMLVDRLSALPDMRLMAATGRLVAGLRDRSDSLRVRTMEVLRIAFLSSAVLEFFAAIGVAMVAVWCGFALLGALGWGSWGHSISAFGALWVLLLAPDFYLPLRDLSAAWHDKAAAEAVAEELAELEQGPNRPILGQGQATAPLPGPATLRLQGVVVQTGMRRITYPDVTVAPGESLAVTGPSGAGKTTLLRLIAGLAAPESGRIEVAGRALGDATADAWRARIGWMPQGPWFLDASLRANLTLGRDGDIDAALEAAAGTAVVAAMPRGLATRLGEAGAGLSGGEARRMALARALHAGPDLILADEPTADLDDVTAAAVIDGLMAQAARGATLIVATHDPRLIARMDKTLAVGEAA